MRSRAPVHKIAAAPSFAARAMIAGGRMYSLKRSGHVEPISLWANRIAPLVFPAREKSASVPSPISTRFESIPPDGVAGPHPSDTARNTVLLLEGERIVSRVAPSFHVTGSAYFSV